VFGGASEVSLRSGARLALPAHGLRHLELVVSPDERNAALGMWSGQSEQGYVLFDLDPLRVLAQLDYVFGEGDAPMFSPDGRWLVIFTANACWPSGQSCACSACLMAR
jgi:hypothetical protein